ncbi:IS3 family transposase [Planctobacterium marinum]
MRNPDKQRVKRTQRDYTLGFKLAVVAQVEKGDFTYKQAQKHFGIQGRSTVLVWLRKHGKLDWSEPLMHSLMSQSNETPAQKIKRLERALADAELKIDVLEEVVTRVDNECGSKLQKKVLRQALWAGKVEKRRKLARCCRLFGFTPQGLYQWVKRFNDKQQRLMPVKDMVLYWRQYMPRIGTRKLYQLMKPELDKLGIKLGRDGLFDYLRAEGMLVKPKRSYTKTTDSRHWMKKHPNLLKDYQPQQAEDVLVSDITYVKSDAGTHYLSLTTDAYSRKIMGYELSDEMKATDVVKALNMSIKHKYYNHPMIHHSDRGVQYCSEEYQAVLRNHNITPSMTDGYDCYQNALAERINGILKQEFLLHQCKNRRELKQLVDESIYIYNEMRPHLSLRMKTPNQVHYEKGR